MKNNVFLRQNLVRRGALFYIFANLFSVWFEGTQLDSHDICISLQSAVRLFCLKYEENLALHRYVVQERVFFVLRYN